MVDRYLAIIYIVPTANFDVGVITYILLVGFPPFLSHADDDDPNTLMNAPFWTLFNERTDMLVDAVKEVLYFANILTRATNIH